MDEFKSLRFFRRVSSFATIDPVFPPCVYCFSRQQKCSVYTVVSTPLKHHEVSFSLTFTSNDDYLKLWISTDNSLS